MRQVFAQTVALAAAELAKALPFEHAQGVARDKLVADAQHLVSRFGHLIQDRKHPAELERKARQRRRARQTHPGKRGKS